METVFLLTFARISGFVLGLPGSRAGFGLKWRVTLAFLVTALLIPGQTAVLFNGPTAAGLPELDFSGLESITVWVRFGQEAALGWAMGLSIAIVFSALLLFGKLVSTASGLSSAEILDPVTNEQAAPVATFAWLIAVVAFIGQGGDRLLLETVLDSFQTVPIVEPDLPLLPAEQVRDLYRPLTDLVQNSFVLGIRLAIPVLLSLFIALLAVAIVSRSVPLINQLTVGMAANALLFWGVFMAGLGVLITVFNQDLQSSLDWTRGWI